MRVGRKYIFTQRDSSFLRILLCFLYSVTTLQHTVSEQYSLQYGKKHLPSPATLLRPAINHEATTSSATRRKLVQISRLSSATTNDENREPPPQPAKDEDDGPTSSSSAASVLKEQEEGRRRRRTVCRLLLSLKRTTPYTRRRTLPISLKVSLFVAAEEEIQFFWSLRLRLQS